MTYEECLERMAPYLAKADDTGEELDRELYWTLQAATARVFLRSEDAVEADVRAWSNRHGAAKKHE